MPSSGIPYSVSVVFSPSSSGPAAGDLIVSCTYPDIFSLGVLSPPALSVVGCRPETDALPITFPNYFAGTGIATSLVPAKSVPTLSPLALLALSIVVAFFGQRSVSLKVK